MSSSFFALELEDGEAFLLRTTHNSQDFTVLVDSGKSSGAGKIQHPLVVAIQKAVPTLRKIDVAICTHQDSDHANGFADFADYWHKAGGTLNEYWLPGRWTAALPMLLTKPKHFIHTLALGTQDFCCKSIRDAVSTFDNHQDDNQALWSLAHLTEESTKQVVAADFSTDGLHPTFPESHDNEDSDEIACDRRLSQSLGLTPAELGHIRTKCDSSDKGVFDFSALSTHLMEPSSCFKPKSLQHPFLEALQVADSISKIVTSAVHHRIFIRWFDFGSFEMGKKPAGGITGLLEPVNSVEIVAPPKPVSPMTLFACLKLSETNVESLVFLRPESTTEPAVLFLADSWLNFKHSTPVTSTDFPVTSSPPQRPFIATAPHHGSNTNDNAYKWIQTWLNGSTRPYYVRNGGEPNQHLGIFTKQPDRACAQCLQCHAKSWHQLITVETQGNRWDWPPVTGTLC